MLKNASLLAKIGADTAENERILPEFCQKNATTLTPLHQQRCHSTRWAARTGDDEHEAARVAEHRRHHGDDEDLFKDTNE